MLRRFSIRRRREIVSERQRERGMSEVLYSPERSERDEADRITL